MNLVEETVARLKDSVCGTGCEDGTVTLRRSPDALTCQYERGVCIESCYGGSTGEFVTFDPIETTTRISSMFGAALPTPKLKGAACAILNVLASFLCLARGVRACPEQDRPACQKELSQLLGGRKVFIAGSFPLPGQVGLAQTTEDPNHADIILITNEGLLLDSVSEIVGRYRTEKEIIFLGPSTAGVAGLQQLRRFCPFGTQLKP